MTVKLTRRQAQVAMLAAATLPATQMARADDFPSKPVRLILPVGAGSGGDAIMRVLGEQLAAQLKQPVVIDNRTGADGLIAIQALLSSPADGYSILLAGPQPMVYNPMLRSNLPYKVSDLRSLSGVVRGWTVLVTGPNSPYTTFESFAAAARKAPEAVSMGTDGLSFRVGAALLGQQLGADFNQVRYTTSSQVLNDLSGNQLDASLTDITRVLELAKNGKLRILAVASKERLPQLPQVPTIREKGVDFDFSLWTALVVRAGTPDAVAKRLEGDVYKALNSAEFKGFLAKIGGVLELSPMNGQAVAAEVSNDTARYQGVMKKIAAELEIEKR